jgi:dTDP-4-amino-4,6-dideoxygalactose transaminase
MNKILQAREEVVALYDQLLDFSKVQKLKIRENSQWNKSYYPVLFKDETTLLKVQNALNEDQIFPRRYFYPSLNTLNYVKGKKMLISENITSRILCLPTYKKLNLC